MIGFDYDKQTFFGLDIPYVQGNTVYSISKSPLNGGNYLCVAGKFVFTIAGTTYHSFAVYNLDSAVWESSYTLDLSIDAYIYNALLNNNGNAILAGQIYEPLPQKASTAQANVLSGSALTAIGHLRLTTKSIALYTNALSQETLFAAGEYYNDTGIAALLSYPLTTGGSWSYAGKENLLYDYFSLSGAQIFYTSGGKGLNGVNA